MIAQKAVRHNEEATNNPMTASKAGIKTLLKVKVEYLLPSQTWAQEGKAGAGLLWQGEASHCWEYDGDHRGSMMMGSEVSCSLREHLNMSAADLLQQPPACEAGIITSTMTTIRDMGVATDELANHDDFPVLNSMKQSTEASPSTPKSSPKKRTAPSTTNSTASQPAKKRATSSPPAKAEDSEITAAAQALLAVAEPAVLKPKRSSPKTKKTAAPSKTAEEWDAETPCPSTQATADTSATTPPSKALRKKGSSPKKSGSDEQLTVHGTPRKRSATKGDLATPRGIPKCWEEAGEADRMLFSMKEEGRDWASIRAQWKVVTGEDTGARYKKTLPFKSIMGKALLPFISL
ncbi:MAG: hypothetical protein Q9217_002499 [Psora testacea]